jgi:hypothetical protein
MARDSEQTVGTALIVAGLCALAVPLLIARRGTGSKRALALASAVVFVPSGILALTAGRKLRVYPPRRKITVGKLHENAAWFKFWRQLGLV